MLVLVVWPLYPSNCQRNISVPARVAHTQDEAPRSEGESEPQLLNPPLKNRAETTRPATNWRSARSTRITTVLLFEPENTTVEKYCSVFTPALPSSKGARKDSIGRSGNREQAIGGIEKIENRSHHPPTRHTLRPRTHTHRGTGNTSQTSFTQSQSSSQLTAHSRSPR